MNKFEHSRPHARGAAMVRTLCFLGVALGLPAGVPTPHAFDQVAAAAPGQKPLRPPDVLNQPTPIDVVREMLNIAGVGNNDIVYDLGSGDGRIVITAARELGARGVGIDIDPVAVWEARERAKDAGVTDRVRFLNEDLFDVDLREATVVTLYLLPALNLRLRPKLLAQLKPGSRIVSHAWDMGDWAPDRTIDVRGSKVSVWTVPPPR